MTMSGFLGIIPPVVDFIGRREHVRPAEPEPKKEGQGTQAQVARVRMRLPRPRRPSAQRLARNVTDLRPNAASVTETGCKGSDMEFYDKTNRVSAAVGRQQDRNRQASRRRPRPQGQSHRPESQKNSKKKWACQPQSTPPFSGSSPQAAAMGDLNTDEAMAVYNALGEYHNQSNDGWAPGVGLATKVIVTQIVSELLARGGAKSRRASIGTKARQARPRKNQDVRRP